MSALPPKADIRPRDQDVCFGPEADSCTAANDDDYSTYLVSGGEQRLRECQAQCLSRLEV
jgi:hypothetical protein